MGRRKGELSPRMIDHDWPYQVAVEERLTVGDRWHTLHYFCKDLSLCSRGHGFYRDGKHFNVFCFAEREHAEMFKAKFAAAPFARGR